MYCPFIELKWRQLLYYIVSCIVLSTIVDLKCLVHVEEGVKEIDAHQEMCRGQGSYYSGHYPAS